MAARTVVWPVSRPCRPRPLLHSDHHDGHLDVCGAKNDADDGDRSFAATHDDVDAVDVHGHVFPHSSFEWADTLYRHTNYNGCDPAVSYESNLTPKDSTSSYGQKTRGTHGAV